MTALIHWSETPGKALFAKVEKDVDRLFDQGDYEQALRVLEETYPGLPTDSLHPQMQDMLMSRAFLLSRLKRAEETLRVIQAFHASGYSCPLDWEIFDLVRSLPGYESVAQENECILAAEADHVEPDLRVFLPEHYDAAKAYPLVLLLHGDSQNSDIMQRMWPIQSMLERDCIVAFIQSTQHMYTGHSLWLRDPEVAWKDVLAYYESVCQQHRIDENSLILGGFSGGAITAIDMTFGEALPVAGFICLCPIRKPEHFTSDAVYRAVKRGVRGVFFEGATVWPVEPEEEMANALRDADMPFKLVLSGGVGHTSPPDFDSKLGDALDYVMDPSQD